MLTIVVITTYFAIFFGVVMWRPGAILGAAISLHAIEQWAQANGAFFVSHSQIINYGFGILVLWALLFSTIRYGSPLRNMTSVAVICYSILVLSYASYFWSIDKESTRFVFESFIPYLGTYVVLIPLIFRNRDHVRQGLICSFFVGGAILAMLFFGTIVGNRSVELTSAVYDRFGNRIESGNPLAIATFAGTMMIIAATLRFRGISKAWQGLRWAILPLALIVCVQSESRGQLFAALGALLIAIPIAMGQFRFQHVIAAAFTFLVLAVLVPVALQNFATMQGRWDPSEQFRDFRETRLDFCSQVISNWLFHGSPVNLVLGMGSSSCSKIIGTYPHVVAVEVLVELGLLGALLGAIVVILTVKNCVMMVRYSRRYAVERGDVAALIGILFFNFILSFKQGSLLGSQVLISFFVLVAMNERMWKDAAVQLRQMRRTMMPQRAPTKVVRQPAATQPAIGV